MDVNAASPAKPLWRGLAPWQERKVLHHVDEHLGQSIQVRDLAGLAGLSDSQFTRRFRGSFGLAPREYLIRRRLEHAKSLLAHTRSPLCEIALASGFCDQSHMSRTFHAIVGSTPNCWRRERGWVPHPPEGGRGRQRLAS